MLDEEKPDYLTVAFDVKAPTFRHKLYDAYKGTRKPMPEELHEQVPVLKDVLHAMGIQTMEKAGLEEELAALEAQLSALDTQLAAQPEVEALQLEREEVQLRLQALRDDPWQVSPQAIASYQAIAPNLVFYLQRWRYDTTDAQVYQLRERLRTHQISAEQFVKDYQHMLWMFNRENGDEAHG